MCNFSIQFNSNADDLVSKAKNAITGAGGSLSGDAAEGSFKMQTFMGEITGSYTTADQTIYVQISKKPMLVPCREIENQLRKYIV
jgi:hypothetical protein